MENADEQDHQFFDILYQQWSKTTWAGNSYWMPEWNESKLMWDLVASAEGDDREWLGFFVNEDDADFIAGLHGAIPDLIRRLHELVDEATRKDEANDEAQGMLADALLENDHLRGEIRDLQKALGE